MTGSFLCLALVLPHMSAGEHDRDGFSPDIRIPGRPVVSARLSVVPVLGCNKQLGTPVGSFLLCRAAGAVLLI